MRLLPTLAAALVTLLPCAAQTLPGQRPDPFDITMQQTDRLRAEEAQRRAADYEAARFQEAMRDFAVIWNDFAAEYIQKHTFNIKKARALNKALRKLEPQLPK